jgi:Mrp family chromosome partitioning ATPase
VADEVPLHARSRGLKSQPAKKAEAINHQKRRASSKKLPQKILSKAQGKMSNLWQNQPKVCQMKSTIFMVDDSKGGVGKSIVCLALIDYLSAIRGEKCT